jgi:hypothetical protein
MPKVLKIYTNLSGKDAIKEYPGYAITPSEFLKLKFHCAFNCRYRIKNTELIKNQWLHYRHYNH